MPCPPLAPEDAVEFVVELGRGIPQRPLERDHGRDLASAGLLAQEALKRSRTSSAVAIWRLVDQGPDERRPRHGATLVIEAGQLVVADQEANLSLR